MTRTLVATPDPEPKPRYRIIPPPAPFNPSKTVTVTSGTWATSAHWQALSNVATTT